MENYFRQKEEQMKYLRQLFIGIGFLLLGSLLVPSLTHANEGQSYEVYSSVLNVRGEPTSDGEIIGVLSKGNKVMAFQEKYGWVQTYYGGHVAWVAKHHLIPVSNTSQSSSANTQSVTTTDSITVTANSVRLRSGPGTDYNVIGSSSAGDTYNIVETNGDWHQIKFSNGSTGWIAAWLTNTSSTSEQSSEPINTSNNTNNNTPQSESLEGYTIVLDPGHGGKDPGAIALNGIYEKDLVSDTAVRVADELRNAGATVIVTRNGDYFVSLDNRASISNSYQTDAFVSLHYDSFPTIGVNGVTTYFGNGSDRGLAQNIQSSLASTVSLDNRGIMQRDFSVLRGTTAPSVLIELGFISNPNDLAIVQTAAYQNQVATAITDGLVDYFHR